MGEIYIEQAIIPVIVGVIVQVFKVVNININKKYLPILSLIVGIGLNFAYAHGTNGATVNVIVGGLVSGAIASGTYDTLKVIFEGIKSVSDLFKE